MRPESSCPPNPSWPPSSRSTATRYGAPWASWSKAAWSGSSRAAYLRPGTRHRLRHRQAHALFREPAQPGRAGPPGGAGQPVAARRRDRCIWAWAAPAPSLRVQIVGKAENRPISASEHYFSDESASISRNARRRCARSPSTRTTAPDYTRKWSRITAVLLARDRPPAGPAQDPPHPPGRSAERRPGRRALAVQHRPLRGRPGAADGDRRNLKANAPPSALARRRRRTAASRLNSSRHLVVMQSRSRHGMNTRTHAPSPLAGVTGQRILTPSGVQHASLRFHGGLIDDSAAPAARGASWFDAGDPLVLPHVWTCMATPSSAPSCPGPA